MRSELLPGEVLHWWGRPNPNRLLTAADFFVVPFSLLWAGFAFFWEGSVLSIFLTGGRESGSWFAVLWGIPFVLIGLYLVFGRFVAKRYAKRHTYYAVTDSRVISISTAFGRRVQSASIKRLPGLELSSRRDGSGTVTFGQSSAFAGMYGNTGMEWLAWGRPMTPLAFYDLDDARSVYNLVERLAS